MFDMKNRDIISLLSAHGHTGILTTHSGLIFLLKTFGQTSYMIYNYSYNMYSHGFGTATPEYQNTM